MSIDPKDLQVAAYADAVRAALADLPAAEQAVLLEDLDDHLREVAAEADEPLGDRLGSPAAYADELRAAYGSGETQRSGRLTRLLSPVDTAVKGLTGSGWFRALRDFLPELRPGWWVLRAYLLVLGLAEIEAGGQSVGLLPNPTTKHGLVEAALAVIAIVISVRLGRLGPRIKGGWRGLAIAANTLIALISLPIVAALSTPNYDQLGQGYSPPSSYELQVLAQGNVVNIYPFAADGTPLKGVLLYDQDGQPITVPGAKGSGLNTSYPQDAQGRPITNEYPQQQTYPDGHPVPAPSVALPQRPVTPSPQPSSSPSPRPSPSP